MKGKKHITLKDMAEALGVSIPTVSRALKDSPEISPAMRAKVQQLAKDMNYHPNPFALSLRKNRVHAIGVIIPDMESYFYSSVLMGVEDTARANGYFIIATSSHESYDLEKENVENLVNMRVEGIIACLTQETTDYAHFAALTDIDMPLVLYDRVCLTDTFPSVVSDGEHSAMLATQHLIDCGCRRIAFIGDSNHMGIVKFRKHGYLEALRENKIPIRREYVICRRINYDEGKRAMETLLALPEPPDAVITIIDMIAFGIMDVIKSHGLRIPEDIAIIGYSDEQHATIVEPKLSSVSHQTYKMGQEACRLLIKRIGGDMKVRQIVIPAIIKIRGSSMKKRKAAKNSDGT